MTPEELFYLIDSDKQPPECIEIIGMVFDTIRRAALRERDARWLADATKMIRMRVCGYPALEASLLEGLRALLEEAGK